MFLSPSCLELSFNDCVRNTTKCWRLENPAIITEFSMRYLVDWYTHCRRVKRSFLLKVKCHQFVTNLHSPHRFMTSP